MLNCFNFATFMPIYIQINKSTLAEIFDIKLKTINAQSGFSKFS